MADLIHFKKLSHARLKTAELLMKANEWGMAAYMLGFVLECILKAAACKALNLAIYPEPQSTQNNKITNYFLTHNFDMLLIISGVSDLFGLEGKGYDSWSGFTQEYEGNWTDIRYQDLSKYDEKKVRGIHKFLTDPKIGIIILMDLEKRW